MWLGPRPFMKEAAMSPYATKAGELVRLGGKIGNLYGRRLATARRGFWSTIDDGIVGALKPSDSSGKSAPAVAGHMPRLAHEWLAYAVDCVQRSVLFCDTIRQRGNIFVEHERAGKPPLLVYDYETIVDGRKLVRPVNYALIRILPPKG